MVSRLSESISTVARSVKLVNTAKASVTAIKTATLPSPPASAGTNSANELAAQIQSTVVRPAWTLRDAVPICASSALED